MKGKLLFAMLLASVGLSAQTTHHISWSMATTNAQASPTIEQGDIVTWTWADTAPHTVTSNAGGAESFASSQLTGNGQTFSHTFANVGATSYKCNVHAMMTGTITVSAVAGIKDNKKVGFEYYPNPVTDVLTVTSQNPVDKIQVFDINGRLVMDSASGNASNKIYMSGFKAGTYIVKVITGSAFETVTVIKK